MRVAFRERLEAGCKKEGVRWNHVTDQIGMFCYTGLSLEQVQYYIYILLTQFHCIGTIKTISLVFTPLTFYQP